MEIRTTILKAPEAILFDMGGVLQDASVTWDADTWQRGTPPDLKRPEPFDWFVDMSRDCIERYLALEPPRPAIDVRPVILEWLERSGMDASSEAVDGLFQQMLWWEVQPIYGFVRPSLERLHALGFRMGVVSNTLMPGTALRENFASAGILEYFDTVIFSAEAGINKPDPRIFGIALEQMGVRPDAAWFVGDKPQRDVLGAHRAGLTAVLVDSEYADRIHDSPAHMPNVRLRDIAELPEVCAGLS
ncbi:MAG TPA: HAD family hydrolase [Candidatus Hydrogenedentes bacterium]|nr:HAD family hydrolase [Candidatus Hydrogenedentota bacterium]